MRPLLKKLLRNQRGVALIEFVLVFPVVMLLILGALEIGRELVITQRTEKASYVIADITSQYPPATAARSSGEISATELTNNVFPQMARIMGIYADPASEAVILTSVVKESGVKHIKWQMAGGGTLTAGVNSIVNGLSPAGISVAVKNSNTSFPANIESLLSTMPDGENLIVAEIFYYYRPVWTQVLGAVPTSLTTGGTSTTGIASAKLLVKRMYFRPRNGDLICLPNSFTYPTSC